MDRPAAQPHCYLHHLEILLVGGAQCRTSNEREVEIQERGRDGQDQSLKLVPLIRQPRAWHRGGLACKQTLQVHCREEDLLWRKHCFDQ